MGHKIKIIPLNNRCLEHNKELGGPRGGTATEIKGPKLQIHSFPLPPPFAWFEQYNQSRYFLITCHLNDRCPGISSSCHKITSPTIVYINPVPLYLCDIIFHLNLIIGF